MTHEPTVQDLTNLLTAERMALLQGTFDALPAIAERKEALFDSVSQGAVVIGPEDLQALQAQNAHNGALLEAAREGLRVSSERLTQMSNANALVTYDQTGATVAQSPMRRFQKRA